MIRHSGTGLFEGVSPGMMATRYHSLVLERDSLPAQLRVDAEAEDGAVMAISHETLPLYGIQFHPESYGTSGGDQLILNFLGGLR